MSNFVTRRPGYDVQREIKRLIIASDLTVGDALPTEAELTAQLGVSRGSLREALKSLEARGIVEVVHGRGMFVGRMSMDALVDGLAFHTQLGSASDSRRLAAELVDVRDLIESALIQRVAAAPDSAALEELEQIVARMEDVTSAAGHFQELDRDFHRVLYEPLDNRVVTLLIKAFWDVLEAARPALPAQLDDRAADAAHHRAILEAVRLGDPGAAYEAMTAHFASAHQWIQAPRSRLSNGGDRVYASLLPGAASAGSWRKTSWLGVPARHMCNVGPRGRAAAIVRVRPRAGVKLLSVYDLLLTMNGVRAHSNGTVHQRAAHRAPDADRLRPPGTSAANRGDTRRDTRLSYQCWHRSHAMKESSAVR